MNRTALVFAAVFFAVIIAFPTYALLTTAIDEQEFANEAPNLADETEVASEYNALTAYHNTLFTITLVIEAVFTVLFLTALYFGIKRDYGVKR
jgi:ABC-type sulfate transport system permease component